MIDFKNFKFANMMEDVIKELHDGDYVNAAVTALSDDGSVMTAFGGESDIKGDPYTLMFLGMHLMADGMLQIVMNNADHIIEAAQNDDFDDYNEDDGGE